MLFIVIEWQSNRTIRRAQWLEKSWHFYLHRSCSQQIDDCGHDSNVYNDLSPIYFTSMVPKDGFRRNDFSKKKVGAIDGVGVFGGSQETALRLP